MSNTSSHTNNLPTTTFFFAIISSSFAIIWSLVFLLTSVFGYRLQKISGNKLRGFYHKVKWASIWTEEDTPDHWILGKWFIGYIYSQQTGQHGGEQKILYLFVHHKWYQQEICGLIDSLAKQEKRRITSYERSGSFWHFKWEQLIIDPPLFEPYQIQTDIINKIFTEYKTRGYATCLLYGPPRSGKSIIPHLLAKRFLETKKHVSLIDTFNPIDPNDIFSTMYMRIGPTQDKPLIVVLEEVDGIIYKMHKNKIKDHEHLTRQVICKGDWNKWLDRFDRGYYKNVIIIMTSNKSIEWFNKLDPSYLRLGRINIKEYVPLSN